jgi:PAS domain-containing protein
MPRTCTAVHLRIIFTTGAASAMTSNGTINGTTHDELTMLRQRVATLEQQLEAYTDMTDLRNSSAQQEQRLRIEQSENYLRAMFSAMRDLVLVLGNDGTYLDIPPTNPDLLYRASTDLIGKRMHDVMPAEIADQYLALINKVIRPRRSSSLCTRSRWPRARSGSTPLYRH